MMTSRPVYTSTPDGYRDAKEIAALRPVAEPKPRAPRKASAKPVVSSGIVCFCGERFSEAQALEFMKHLRAEYGEVLEWRERRLEQQRKHKRHPEVRAKLNSRQRKRYATDEEFRERKKAARRELDARKKAEGVPLRKPLTPEQLERKRLKAAERRQDPDYRKRVSEYQRKRYANPEVRARRVEDGRKRRSEPGYRERQAEYYREWRARKKAEREADAAPS